eukprot:Plantae.Rhodophyta-Hildenbrandia_rubra.ctg6548.p1 GENE.Plantae.Rhodophyta-Hildenbrandia_rubra.ctg6548~~Plantae.Rhodophyta-Hildenbrandia_rubra.ctg6548.p1  ORF type:complete len:760 (-),score=85.80 Plantae.Rhodophyta-Hildenbrandia_rubra.ctg6548:1622-3901(-)
MELKYGSPPISWTRLGYPLLHTRPYHTLHRRDYSTHPRIHPIEHHASLIFPPSPQNTPNPAKPFSETRQTFSEGEDHPFLDEDPRTEQHQETLARKCARGEARVFSRKQWADHGKQGVYVPEWLIEEELVTCMSGRDESKEFSGDGTWGTTSGEIKRGNCMKVVVIGGENVIVWSRNGNVGGLGIYRCNGAGKLVMSGESIAESSGLLQLNVFYAPVLEVSQGDSEASYDEEEVISVRTKNSIVILVVDLEFRLSVRSVVDLTNIVGVATTSILPNEVAILHDGGSILSVVEDELPVIPTVSNIVRAQKPYKNLWYGAHKRSLLCASDRNIYRVHIGEDGQNSPTALVDIFAEWTLPADDYGISACVKNPTNPFQTIIVTETRLAIGDERMFRFPILDWSLNRVHKFSYMRCTVSTLGSDKGSIIAVGSGYTGSLEIYHSLPSQTKIFGQGDNDTPLSTFTPSNIFQSSLAWSDLPVGVVDTFPASDPVEGVAILTAHDNQERFLVVQASSSGALAVQKFECDRFVDRERDFEAPVVGNQEGLSGIDDEWDVRAMSFRVAQESQLEAIPHKTYCRNEAFGHDCLKHMRRPRMNNILRVRSALTSSIDDDIHLTKFGRSPRPFLGTRKMVKKQRNDVLQVQDESVFLDGLVAFLSVPRPLSEILEYIRRGYTHVATPISAETIVAAISDTEIKEYSVDQSSGRDSYSVVASHVYTNNDSLEEQGPSMCPQSDMSWKRELESLEQAFWKPVDDNLRKRLLQ